MEDHERKIVFQNTLLLQFQLDNVSGIVKGRLPDEDFLKDFLLSIFTDMQKCINNLAKLTDKI